MKKALLCGQFISKPYKGITRGVKEGFESLGYETYPLEFEEADDLKDIMEKILAIKPDVVFTQAIIDRGKFNNVDVTSMLAHLKKILNFKLVYQEGDYKDVKEREAADMSMFDLILFNQDYQLDEHAKKWGIERSKCIVFPYASFIYKHPPQNCFFTPSNFNIRYPLVFIGSTGNQYPFRQKVLKVLRNVVTIKPKNRNIDGVDYMPKYKEILNDIDAWEASVEEDGVKFFYFMSNSTMRMYDMAATDSNLYLRMALKPERDITEVEDENLYEDHLETIIAGVKDRILKMPGKPWTNQTAARQAYIDWRRGVSKARSMFDKGYTNNPQTVYPKSFGDID